MVFRPACGQVFVCLRVGPCMEEVVEGPWRLAVRLSAEVVSEPSVSVVHVPV